MTDLASAKEADATARAESLTRQLADVSRHERRDDAGRFRPRSAAEAHAEAVGAALRSNGAKHQTLTAVLGYGDPLAGRVESTARLTLQGGYMPPSTSHPLPAEAQATASRALLDALFPSRDAGRLG